MVSACWENKKSFCDISMRKSNPSSISERWQQVPDVLWLYSLSDTNLIKNQKMIHSCTIFLRLNFLGVNIFCIHITLKRIPFQNSLYINAEVLFTNQVVMVIHFWSSYLSMTLPLISSYVLGCVAILAFEKDSARVGTSDY